MKTLKFFIGILFLSIFILSSCGSDDDNRSEYDFNAVCKIESNLLGIKNQTQIVEGSYIKLDDMLKGNNYVPPVIRGELHIGSSSSTFMRIVGLQEGDTLKNFTLTINKNKDDLKQSFGDIVYKSAQDNNADLFTNSTYPYFEKVFNRMIERKEIRVDVEFIPTRNLTDDKVKLEMAFHGKFIYRK